VGVRAVGDAVQLGQQDFRAAGVGGALGFAGEMVDRAFDDCGFGEAGGSGEALDLCDDGGVGDLQGHGWVPYVDLSIINIHYWRAAHKETAIP
jgi:hypothetical protein